MALRRLADPLPSSASCHPAGPFELLLLPKPSNEAMRRLPAVLPLGNVRVMLVLPVVTTAPVCASAGAADAVPVRATTSTPVAAARRANPAASRLKGVRVTAPGSRPTDQRDRPSRRVGPGLRRRREGHLPGDRDRLVAHARVRRGIEHLGRS